MPSVMATLPNIGKGKHKVNLSAGEIPLGAFASGSENNEERKFRNSIPCTTP